MTIWTTAKDLHRILDEEWEGKNSEKLFNKTINNLNETLKNSIPTIRYPL